MQSTSHPSSVHGSESSNGTQYTPNADMGQFPWVQSVYIPYICYAPPYPYYPYGVLPNGTHGAAPLYTPVVPSPGVGAGVAHPAFQAGPGGCYPPPAATAPPTQHPFVPPMYHQLFSSSSFPGAMTPYPPGISHQAYHHQNHGAGLATGSPSSFLPQAPRISVGQKRVVQDLEDRNVKRTILPQAPRISASQKRVAQDLEDRDIKRTKVVKVKNPKTGGIENDPFFTPALNGFGQNEGRYICSKDGMIIRPGSYHGHIHSVLHDRGSKPKRYKCPLCLKTFTRRKQCKKHWDNYCRKKLVAAPLSYSNACQGFMSSASGSPVGVPTTTFTFSLPTTATTSDSSSPESMPTEAAEDSPNPDSGAAIEIQDAALVAPVLPPSEVREITLAEVGGSYEFWKWINSTEDDVAPILPDSEPSSSRLPETILAEAAEDPDVWMLINEAEDFVHPELPLCESPADAAEDPDFCNFPIRTLLICSWLNNSE